MEERCGWCGRAFDRARTGRPRRFCSARCRVAASRCAIPLAMRSRTAWVRCDGKRPITLAGAPASSTDPGTWSGWSQVRRATAGDGFGTMLGDGLGCWDLDHFDDQGARAFIDRIDEPIIFAERSVSGHGFHIFVRTDEAPGRRTGNIEFYSRHRFIRVTGDQFV
ncbi:bifunctional DNA primase/polymerase [Propionibacterium freudenreichii]|uniref:bifunctional DNA primase/polymerase n=1 Tax=Propionibacterium freudenreichii TaxID=1744 RepID=UPI002A2BD550|nr:DNA primase [Propionibacterium freudenreichii]